MTDPEPALAPEAVITYVLLQDAETGEPVPSGEFPHCPMWNLLHQAVQCPAGIDLSDVAATQHFQCTRDKGHPGSHVHHARPGLPLVAWLLKATPS